MTDYTVRPASSADLDAVKKIADAHKYELGFVLRPALANSIDRGELFVAENAAGVIGFVDFHHRRDEQTTLYHIVVEPDHRVRGIGHALVEALIADAREQGKSVIQLKCPQDLSANAFYQRLGFYHAGTNAGKNRPVHVWRIEV